MGASESFHLNFLHFPFREQENVHLHLCSPSKQISPRVVLIYVAILTPSTIGGLPQDTWMPISKKLAAGLLSDIKFSGTNLCTYQRPSWSVDPGDIQGNSIGFADFCRQFLARDGGIGPLLHQVPGKILGPRDL